MSSLQCSSKMKALLLCIVLITLAVTCVTAKEVAQTALESYILSKNPSFDDAFNSGKDYINSSSKYGRLPTLLDSTSEHVSTTTSLQATTLSSFSIIPSVSTPNSLSDVTLTFQFTKDLIFPTPLSSILDVTRVKLFEIFWLSIKLDGYTLPFSSASLQGELKFQTTILPIRPQYCIPTMINGSLYIFIGIESNFIPKNTPCILKLQQLLTPSLDWLNQNNCGTQSCLDKVQSCCKGHVSLSVFCPIFTLANSQLPPIEFSNLSISLPPLGKLIQYVSICPFGPDLPECRLPCTSPPTNPITPPCDDNNIVCSWDNLPRFTNHQSLIDCCNSKNDLIFDSEICCDFERLGDDMKKISRCSTQDPCLDMSKPNNYKACCSSITDKTPAWKIRQCCKMGVDDGNKKNCCSTPYFDHLCLVDQQYCCSTSINEPNFNLNQCCPSNSPFFSWIIVESIKGNPDAKQLLNKCCKSNDIWKSDATICPDDPNQCTKLEYFQNALNTRHCCEQRSFPVEYHENNNLAFSYCCQKVISFWKNHKEKCCSSPIHTSPPNKECPQCATSDCYEDDSNGICPCDFPLNQCPDTIAITWQYDNTLYIRPDDTMKAKDVPIGQSFADIVSPTTFGATLTLKKGWTYYASTSQWILDDETLLGTKIDIKDSTAPQSPVIKPEDLTEGSEGPTNTPDGNGVDGDEPKSSATSSYVQLGVAIGFIVASILIVIQ